MSCPRCGDVCHCDSEFRSPQIPDRMKRPRFEVEAASHSTVLVDPEAYDRSEEQFAASLAQTQPKRPKFVLDRDQTPTASPETQGHCSVRAGNDALDVDREPVDSERPATASSAACESAAPSVSAQPDEIAQEHASSDSAQPLSTSSAGPDADAAAEPTDWKDEVAARLNSYRARRKPRPPRYPSLRLKFETPAARTVGYEDEPLPPIAEPPAPASRESHALAAAIAPVEEQVYVPPAETGRIIEFPRSYYTAAPPTYELAEPVMEGPRILEVPDIAPPPPALGGISLPAEDKQPEKRPGFEIPLQTPPMSQRIWAMAIDGAIVLCACALFGYIVFKITGATGPVLTMMETFAAVAAIFWAGYQYLLLIYTGSTPGLRLARLRLTHFDGSPVPRSTRRWRVIASILSAGSLGLGFAWSYLDEDALCWHDRITHTYLAAIR
jgi:uncharacterized RDD family membrane protein YckC